MRKSEAAV
jgi:hypothetical protein